jgi:hypothetical protein
MRLVFVVAILGAVMKAIGPKIGEVMERKFEEASDDFPPKWMFLNITAIRETNERILSLLEERVERLEGGQ